MLSKKALESSKSNDLKKFRKFLNFKNLQVKCLIEFHHSPKCPFKTPNIRSIPSFFLWWKFFAENFKTFEYISTRENFVLSTIFVVFNLETSQTGENKR